MIKMTYSMMKVRLWSVTMMMLSTSSRTPANTSSVRVFRKCMYRIE